MSDISQLITKTTKILQNQYQKISIDKYLVVHASKQKIYLVENNNVCFESFVSTSKNGLGNEDNSFKTPVGLHSVKEKIGDEQPKYTIFKARQPTKLKYDLKNIPNEDLITSRIIWLNGMEKGINSGGNVDTYSRYIYIHGTPHEKEIGTPVSHGCIRMKNDEIIDLFQRIEIGTPVIIIDD